MTDPTRGDTTVLTADRVVTPEAVLEPGTVVVDGDQIATVRRGVPRSAAVDAHGELLLPGLVDLHGDDIESHLFPRADARAPTETALLACDRANVASGITTKFHAVAFEEAPGEDRSVETARDLVEAVASSPPLLGDNRVHVRCELGNDACVAAAADAVGRDVVGIVSLMNHVPGEGQFEDQAAFERRYDGGSVGGTQPVSERRRTTPNIRARRAQRVLSNAAEAGTVAAVHDASADSVDQFADAGVAISEFPLTLAAARRAAERGLVTALGAPNLVRGGSLWGNLDVAEAIDAGVADVLCTDYRPYSLLESAFVDTGEPLPDRVARVSAAPAAAVGLTDRGRVRPGARADLLLVRTAPDLAVERVLVAGATVYQADPGGEVGE